MMCSIREVVEELIGCNMAKIAYYNHSPKYLHVSPVDETLNDYDGSDDFYEEYEPVLLMFGHGDYVGDDISMANMRYVENNYKELFESGGIEYRTLGYGYSELVVFFLRPSVARSGLFDDLQGLDGYPLICEDTHSETTEELLNEAWESWGRSDFETEIEKRTSVEFTETEWQDSLFFEILRHGDGSEYHPEGTSMYIDFEQVFDDSDTLIALLVEHAESLETGEFEIESEWRVTGMRLGLNWSYNGEATYQDRKFMVDFVSNKTELTQEILNYYGLQWHEVRELFWEVKPINEPLKIALKSGINYIKPIRHNTSCFCSNCNDYTVMSVNHNGPKGFINVCPDCYNKLMEYWPKCNHCKVKNVNASLQLSLLPDFEDSPLTHCKECKNSLLAA